MNNIFKEIKTEEEAYILGFIAADGVVSSTSNQIRIELKNGISEYKLLKQIYTILNLKTKFTTPKNRNSYLIYFNSKNIKNTLAKYNITPNKTFTVTPPNISKELIRHYLRGYFDGDGWITYSKPKNNSYIVAGLIGNKYFVEETNNIILKNLGIKLSITNNKNMKQLACSGCYKTYKFLDYLYKDASIYLDRKYLLYINLKKFIDNKNYEAEKLSKLICPYCRSQGLKKNGSKNLKTKKVLRYKCLNCGRSTINPQ